MCRRILHNYSIDSNRIRPCRLKALRNTVRTWAHLSSTLLGMETSYCKSYEVSRCTGKRNQVERLDFVHDQLELHGQIQFLSHAMSCQEKSAPLIQNKLSNENGLILLSQVKALVFQHQDQKTLNTRSEEPPKKPWNVKSSLGFSPETRLGCIQRVDDDFWVVCRVPPKDWNIQGWPLAALVW